MKRIKLTKNKVAIVDDEDYPYISRFKWSFCSNGHAVRNSIRVYLEFFIKNKKSNERFVFKDRNPLNLRKENILVKTFSNACIGQGKCRPKKTSKYRGVCWDKRYSCWCAYVNWLEQGKRKRIIKYFKYEIEAVKWRDKKAKELYGELAYQNKI